MKSDIFTKTSQGAVPVWLLFSKDIASLSKMVSTEAANCAKAAGFNGAAGKTCLVPGNNGKLSAVLFGLGDADKWPSARDRAPMMHAKLARTLPTGTYKLKGTVADPQLAALAWALGGYRFTRYKKGGAGKTKAAKRVQLALPAKTDADDLLRVSQGVMLARDLINTPTNDLGPNELEAAIRKLARQHKANLTTIKGDALLKKNLPMIHAVGRASVDAPRLVDFKWGNARHPKVTLVGKGVCFDTGGLNIKPGNSMALMKKDMGGAANVLGLAHMIMDAKLPVRLRVLVPTVENSISGNAFRPGDVLPSRKGISVEIGNTDAEGRLILADALALADEEKPQMLIDMATLTGAARVALGPDLMPFYTDDDVLAKDLERAAQKVQDPLWRMPLWSPYFDMMTSRIADINHISAGGFAGSITAAMFLTKFVERAHSFAHFDIFGWTPSEKPWATVGGEGHAIRAIYAALCKRYPR